MLTPPEILGAGWSFDPEVFSCWRQPHLLLVSRRQLLLITGIRSVLFNSVAEVQLTLDPSVYLVSTAMDLLLKNLALKTDCLADLLCLSLLGNRSRVTDWIWVWIYAIPMFTDASTVWGFWRSPPWGVYTSPVPGLVYVFPIVFHCRYSKFTVFSLKRPVFGSAS